MPERRGSRYHALSQALAAVIAVASARAVPAAPIDIGGRATLTADVTALGLELRVAGTVRDDTGRPIAHRAVSVTGRPSGATDAERGFRADVATDADGRFELARRVSAGAWHVRVRFDGDVYVDAAEATSDVEVRPQRARARLEVPAVVDASVGTVPVSVRVAVGGEPASGIVVGAFADCGVVTRLAPTDHEGASYTELAFVDPTSSTCEVAVSARGEGRFADVEAHATVRRVTEPLIEIGSTHRGGGPFGGGEWQLVVRARDEHGAIAGAPVTLAAAGAARRSTTDADGVVRFETPADPRGVPESVTASLLGHPGPVLAAATVTLEAPIPAASAFGRVAGGIAVALGLALLVALVRDVRPRLPSRSARPSPARTVATERIEGPTNVEGPRVWTVHVRDADDDTPVVASVSGPDGVHATDEGGAVALPYERAVDIEVVAPGYLPLRVAVSPPRRSRRTVLRLRSVRAEARDILRLVVAELDAVSDATSWWGTRTIDEVRSASSRGTWRLRRDPERDAIRRREIARLVTALREGTGTEADAFDALSFLVDAVYFGGAGDPDYVLELARELADLTRGRRDA